MRRSDRLSLCEAAARNPAPPADPLLAMEATLRRIYAGIRDASVIANPYVFLGTATFPNGRVPITPGSVVELYTNNEDVPVLVAAQAQGNADGQRSYLYLSRDALTCTLAQAKVRSFDYSPRAALILAPNEAAFADATDPDIAGTNVQNVTWVAVRLHGTVEEF